MGHRHRDRHHLHAAGNRADPHGTMGLVRRPGGRVHRLGRRTFLTELGRSTFAVAILGAAAACSDDDDGASDAGTAPTLPGSGSTATASTATGSTATASTSPPASTDTGSAPGSTEPASEAGSADDGTATDGTDTALQWAQVDLGFVSAYVLVRGNTAAVVDTGTAGSADQIGQTLTTLGLTFADVAHVILTHHHPDHIGSLPDVLERAPSASAYAGEADLPSIPSPATAVFDGDDVFGLQVIETPGHTPGSIAVLDSGIGLLVAGDALNGADGASVTGPNEQFTADMDTALASVAKLATFDFETAVFGHGPPVTSGAADLVRALA